ncbi:MAG: uroporphyrinogen-III synthase [Thermoplasmata archaeon]|nr:uroporphyrinogen-III synthase [Thermoplasmata archaeon]
MATFRAVTAARPRPVGLVAAVGTFTDLEDALRQSGRTVVRFDAILFEPVLPADRCRRLRRAPWDGIVLSSPRGVPLFLRPVFGRASPKTRRMVAYVAGESTAVEAERLGYTVVRPSDATGSGGILRAVPGGTPLRLLHPRSDVAGPGLARALRSAGHTVVDVVAFRTMTAPSMPGRVRAGLLRAEVVVVSSPSAFRSLRSHLGPRAFRTLARTVAFRGLGPSTEGAVRRAGVRDVAVLDPGPGQRFTPATVGSLLDGRATSD